MTFSRILCPSCNTSLLFSKARAGSLRYNLYCQHCKKFSVAYNPHRELLTGELSSTTLIIHMANSNDATLISIAEAAEIAAAAAVARRETVALAIIARDGDGRY